MPRLTMMLRLFIISGVTLILVAGAPRPATGLVPLMTMTQTHQSAQLEFLRITDGDLVNSGGMSRGVAWGDYNGDGFADLFVANSDSQTNALYRNNQDGTFTTIDNEITQIRANSESGNWIDYDNDGDLDLFVTNIRNQANFLYRNEGDDTFTHLTNGALAADAQSSTGSCWADYDVDGDLDVLVANRDGQDNAFFVNNGDGTFMATELFSGHGGDSRACGWAYANDDLYLDLYVGNAHEPNFFYLGNSDGTFTQIMTGSFVTASEYTYGLSWADVDNDDDIDLFVANLEASNDLYRNGGNDNFERVEDDPIALNFGPSKGNTWGDYDNDGDLDLYVAHGTPNTNVQNALYLNDGQGHFEQMIQGDIVLDNNISAGTAWADYDNDGDLDLYVANWRDNNEDNAFYQNHSPAENGWVKINLVGVESNRQGIGSIIRLNADIGGQNRWQMRQIFGNTGYGSQNASQIHIGVGDAPIIHTLEIRWPSGHVDVYHDLPINNVLTIVEGEGVNP